MTIHSDETRDQISNRLYRLRYDQINEFSQEFVDDVIALLAKEQTRLLDRVLEEMPKKNYQKVTYVDADGVRHVEMAEILHDDYNQALTNVTATIQKLKGEIV